jgi:hypothetical protein
MLKFLVSCIEATPTELVGADVPWLHAVFGQDRRLHLHKLEIYLQMQ